DARPEDMHIATFPAAAGALAPAAAGLSSRRPRPRRAGRRLMRNLASALVTGRRERSGVDRGYPARQGRQIGFAVGGWRAPGPRWRLAALGRTGEGARATLSANAVARRRRRRRRLHAPRWQEVA